MTKTEEKTEKLEKRTSCEMTVITPELKLITINCSIITTLAGMLSSRKIKLNIYLQILVTFASTTSTCKSNVECLMFCTGMLNVV